MKNQSDILFPGPVDSGLQAIEDHATGMLHEESDPDLHVQHHPVGTAVVIGNTPSDSFHGPGGGTLARCLPGKSFWKNHTFFRILEGTMAKYTFQGPIRNQKADFVVQLYTAFSDSTDEADSIEAKKVFLSPTGMPLAWDAKDLSFASIVSDLQTWKICGAKYYPLDIQHVSETYKQVLYIYIQTVSKTCQTSVDRGWK